MSVEYAILTALARAAGPICDDCLAEKARLSRRQVAHQYCSRLAEEGRIVRQSGIPCSACGRPKLTNVIGREREPARDAPGSEGRRTSHETNLRDFLAALLEKRGRGQFALGGRPRWDGRLLDDTIISKGGRILAAVELEARTDKQVRGAIWDLIEYGAPLSVLVWASGGYGSTEGPGMVRRWIGGLAAKLGIATEVVLKRFVVLVDSMGDDDPEVERFFRLLDEATKDQAK